MSTQQLIILWWGFTALMIAMLMGANALLTFSIAIILLILLVLYSFKKYRHISRHKLMIAIGFPMMVLGITGFISGGSVDNPELDFNSNTGISLPAESVKIISPQIKHKFFVDTLTGTLQNNSQMNVNQVGLKVLLDANTPHAEEWFVPLKNLSIAPGQSVFFQTKIGDFHFRQNSKWKWNYQVLSVVGE